MEKLRTELIDKLREQARSGMATSGLARLALERFASGELHPATLIQYFRRAFGLSMGQVSPLAGWASDGSGDLSDAQLDSLVDPEIRNRRSQ